MLPTLPKLKYASRQRRIIDARCIDGIVDLQDFELADVVSASDMWPTLPGKDDMRRCIVRINGGVSRAVLYILDIDASVSLIPDRNGPALRVSIIHALRFPMVRS